LTKRVLIVAAWVGLASVTPASAQYYNPEYQCEGGWQNTGIAVQFIKYATKLNEIRLTGALLMDQRYVIDPRGKGVILNGKRCRLRIDEGHQREEEMTTEKKQLQRARDALADIIFKSTDSWAVERARKAFDERTPLNEP
jgi:hypothetical protein